MFQRNTPTTTHIHKYTHMYVHIQCTHAHTRIHTLCIYAHTHAHTTHTHRHMYTYAYTHTHAHMHTHAHICTCTHTQTHAHIHTCKHTHLLNVGIKLHHSSNHSGLVIHGLLYHVQPIPQGASDEGNGRGLVVLTSNALLHLRRELLHVVVDGLGRSAVSDGVRIGMGTKRKGRRVRITPTQSCPFCV